MKKYILLFFALVYGSASFCQEVVKATPGAIISLQPGAVMTVKGGITLDNGSQLYNNGTITIQQNGATGAADLLDHTGSGAYNYGPGKWLFNGTGRHTVFSHNGFGVIDVQAGGMVLNTDITAAHWRLETGIVHTGSNKAIVTGTENNDLEPAASNPIFINSWINGNLRRYLDFNTNNFNLYLYPIGTVSSRNFIIIGSQKPGNLSGVRYVDAYFDGSSPADAGLLVSEGGRRYISVHPAGVWQLAPAAGSQVSGVYYLKTLLNGFAGLSDNNFALLQRPALSTGGADWTVPAGSSLNMPYGGGRLVADNYSFRAGMSVFGQFGLGILPGAQALRTVPVVIAGFDALRINKLSVTVHWQTTGETNSKGFIIERRLDNDAVFTEAGFVNSKAPEGNSHASIDYQFTDANGTSGITYYRLKQVDLQNQAYYSLIKAVNGLADKSVSVLLWPNPNRGQFSIRVEGAGQRYEASITDIQGRLVKKVNINGTMQADISGLTAGTYIIVIPDAFGNGKSFTEKVMVLR
jgi:Secretion system C-terminal sorting domain